MPTPTAFRHLQLQVLRSLSKLLCVLAALWLLYAPMIEPTSTVVMRTAMAVGNLVVLARSNEHNAAAYGMAAIVTFKLTLLCRLWLAPLGLEITEDALHGSSRLLPLLAAIFGGVRVCLFVAVMCSVDPIAVVALKRFVGTAAAGEAVSLATLLFVSENDVRIVCSHTIYIATAAMLGITLVRCYRNALDQLVDALKARQSFITNMVRPATRAPRKVLS